MITSEEQFLEAAKRAYLLSQEKLRLRRATPTTRGEKIARGLQEIDAGLEYSRIRREMEEYDERYNSDRKGRWTTPLFTGRRFWPESPKAGDFDVRDIAHALARVNRFNGHTPKSYSVAQHSILVSQQLPKELKLFGLLHDAGEGYLGDLISPIKRLFKEFYAPIEDGIMVALAEQLGFPSLLHSQTAKDMVKKADNILLATEVRDLTTTGFIWGDSAELPLDKEIGYVWPAELAEEEFLERFRYLYGVPAERIAPVQITVLDRRTLGDSPGVPGRKHGRPTVPQGWERATAEVLEPATLEA